MFDFNRTRKVQLILRIVMVISILIWYFTWRGTFNNPQDLEFDLSLMTTCKCITITTVIVNIVIDCLIVDIKENLNALKKRSMEEIENVHKKDA